MTVPPGPPATAPPQAAPLFTLLLRAAIELVEGCACTQPRGCPSCVQHVDCSNYNVVGSGVRGEWGVK